VPAPAPRPWAGVLRPLLRRRPAEIEARARPFAIRTEEGRALVAGLGRAFIGGYNAMLGAGPIGEVAAEGMRVPPRFRPFFFEGAAMGYLPRGYLEGGRGPARAEADLLGIAPAFKYLYYVGLGFWLGLRHPRRVDSIETLAPHLDPMYLPLCHDGFGFKVGFFDHVKDASAAGRLEAGPPELRPFLHQGFGRALFFVFMDDRGGFERVCDALPRDRRADLEFGRALALGFTHVDAPARLLDRVLARAGCPHFAHRLTGLTWALAAREMSDPAYFASCLAGAPAAAADLLRALPAACRTALAASKTYAEWQGRTGAAVTGLVEASGLIPPSPRAPAEGSDPRVAMHPSP
jgi:hypothetical protein